MRKPLANFINPTYDGLSTLHSTAPRVHGGRGVSGGRVPEALQRGDRGRAGLEGVLAAGGRPAHGSLRR